MRLYRCVQVLMLDMERKHIFLWILGVTVILIFYGNIYGHLRSKVNRSIYGNSVKWSVKNGSGYPKSQTHASGFFDFPNMEPIRFSRNFKNPCWIGKKDNGPIHDNAIHCVPYFYIIGVMKCGTTDLFQRLKLHPDVVDPGFKEAQWFAHTRTWPGLNTSSAWRGKTDQRHVRYFVEMYRKATREVLRNPSIDQNGTRTYNHVFADASPSNIYLNPRWWLLPGNENRTEPRYTNLHCIHKLSPEAKIIVLFRDPVARLYSDYYFRFRYTGTPSKNSFHEMVVKATTEFNKCLQRRPLRTCAYKDTEWTKGIQFRLDLGLYAFYIKEVHDVFKKENVHTIIQEDYKQDMRSSLEKVIAFLGLRSLSHTGMNALLEPGVHNNKSYLRDKSGPMLRETERLLREFYKPYNREMAEYMGDSRYLFPGR